MVTGEDASKEIVEGRRCVISEQRILLAHLSGVTPGDHCMGRNT